MTATFYLGAHMPHWLTFEPDVVGYPLFVSHRRLVRNKSLPRAVGPWALDSGGFTELSMHGGWRTTPREYASAVARYSDQVGRLAWAAPQDWMCEPSMLAKTRKTVAEHQRLTIENYIALHDMAPQLPFIPVLQGWTRDDYLRCADAYERAGVDLAAEPTVGVGSVCRRQGTEEIRAVMIALADRGLRLHGFGVKTLGLASYSAYLASSDSMAWSSRGRHEPGCGPSHRTEANCGRFAREWRGKVLRLLAGPTQLDLWAVAS